MRGLILLALSSPFACGGGQSDCPCITAYPSGIDTNTIALSGQTYSYPSNYGLNTCAEHDQGMPPYCTNSPVPSWCNTTWCYIDTASCTRTHGRSTYCASAGLDPADSGSGHTALPCLASLLAC